MRYILIALIAIALVGCRSEHTSQADMKVLCDLEGRAYYVQPGVGDTSFVRRTSSADALCKGVKQ